MEGSIGHFAAAVAFSARRLSNASKADSVALAALLRLDIEFWATKLAGQVVSGIPILVKELRMPWIESRY